MDASLESRLERLLDKQACMELVHRLARGLDRCDYNQIERLFHPGATDDHGSFKGTAADFVPWVREVLKTMTRTQHVIGNILIEFDGDTARGESYFIAHHALPQPGGGESFMIAAGRYLDRFEKRDGEWKFAHRGAVYDWSSVAPSSDMWDRAQMPTYTFGERGRTDDSYRHFAGAASSAS